MARIEFSANPTPLQKRPRPTPPSDQDGTRHSVDYISDLPDAIILHIFSFLTTKEAIKTSMLSRQWRSKWTANPHISFSMPFCYDFMKIQNFLAFMREVRLRCTAVKVKSFLLDFACLASSFPQRRRTRRGNSSAIVIAPVINSWLHFAVGHNVEEVSITLRNDNNYQLPQLLFRCPTLVSLHVCHCRISMMVAVKWPSLKRLCISDTTLMDDDMMRVLNGCPVLEFFELKACWGFKHIKVESRFLRELVIDYREIRNDQASILKISVPHLLKLRLSGDSMFKVDPISSLVEADLNFKVLSSTDARELFLPSLECRHLMLHVAADHVGAPHIVKILESSPHLEKLFLQMTCTPTFWLVGDQNVGRSNFDAEEFRNPAKGRVYQCLMLLKNVKIVDPGANCQAWEPVLSLLDFLLQNAPSLDKIEINSYNSGVSRAVEPWVLLEVVQMILSHPNRSPSLKVILRHPSQGCPSSSVLKCDFYVSPDAVFS
ncbi:putative F-box/LRR-repeat protein At3g18150 [Eucalyptus grandis]|uniref:putative F-box/LRR-repeat protein At3g18150 n=1 Tax=Eucalyptus grandis TaxID=71139 RepID=UPI00192E76FD|nr:putative F-box/LRR-repeat protein At3g18150 [Eucalyptus grandis]